MLSLWSLSSCQNGAVELLLAACLIISVHCFPIEGEDPIEVNMRKPERMLCESYLVKVT